MQRGDLYPLVSPPPAFDLKNMKTDNRRFKLVLVNDATGEERDSLIKGADMLSLREAQAVVAKTRTENRMALPHTGNH